MSQKDSFSVVHFPIDGSIEVVPCAWILVDESSCPFPKNRPKGFQKLQETSDSVPDPRWPFWDVQILGSYGDFSKANKKARKALKSLNLESSAPEGSQSPVPTTSYLALIQNDLSGDAHNSGEQLDPDSRINNNEEQDVPNSLGQNITLTVTDERVSTLIEELRAFQSASLQNQILLQEEIRNLKNIVLRFIQKTTNEPQISSAQNILWPVKTEEELDHANLELKIPEIFNYQVALLSRIGGGSVSKTVYNILRFIIDHQLALRLRLTNSSGKLAFEKTLCLQLVKEAVWKYYPLETADEKTKLLILDDKLDSIIAKWLRESANRGVQGKQFREKARQKNGSSKDNKNEASKKTSGQITNTDPSTSTSKSDDSDNPTRNIQQDSDSE